MPDANLANLQAGKPPPLDAPDALVEVTPETPAQVEAPKESQEPVESEQPPAPAQPRPPPPPKRDLNDVIAKIAAASALKK